jgi:hypothetical protein
MAFQKSFHTNLVMHMSKFRNLAASYYIWLIYVISTHHMDDPRKWPRCRNTKALNAEG